MQVLKDPPCSASHYYLRSLSWTSRTFYFPDSRDLREVLRDFLGRERERGGGPYRIANDGIESSAGGMEP